ncbi:MAG: SH3 domain-containing protein [Chloroflexota bacterium]
MQYRRIFVTFLLAMLGLSFAAVATAQNGVVGYVNTGALNLRPVPGATDNVPILEIPQNAYVQLLARTADGNWYRATYDRDGYSPVTGWVASRYITITTGSAMNLPITDGRNAPAIYGTASVTTDVLNVRSVPTTANNTPIGRVFPGNVLEVAGRNSDGSWLYVLIGNGEMIGWVRSSYVRLNGSLSINQIQVVSSSYTPPVVTPPVTPVAQGVVNTGALNIRTVPRWWGNTPITFVYRSTPLTITGRNHDASWLQVRTGNGTVGWVRSRYVSVTAGNVNSLPITG